MNDFALEKIKKLIDWKLGVTGDVQTNPEKIRDLYYYVKGILVGKCYDE